MAVGFFKPLARLWLLGRRTGVVVEVVVDDGWTKLISEGKKFGSDDWKVLDGDEEAKDDRRFEGDGRSELAVCIVFKCEVPIK